MKDSTSKGGLSAAGIQVRGLSLARAGQPVLDRLDLDLGQGERLAVLGHSGAGKTTLLRLLAGLEPPDSGSITLSGQLASAAGSVRIPPHLRQTGLVFQAGALWPHMTVAQHLRFATGRLPRAVRAAQIAETIRSCALSGLEARFPDQLSGGEQRRLALARALAARPRWLLLDEPLVNLDPALSAELIGTIDAAVEATVGLILVTHDRSEAEALCPLRLHLESGRLGPQPGALGQR